MKDHGKYSPFRYYSTFIGKKASYVTYVDESLMYFLPILLPKKRGKMFTTTESKYDIDIDLVVNPYIFVFDLLRGLSCSVTGIFLDVGNSPNGEETLVGTFEVSQSNEIGTCFTSVSLPLVDAVAFAFLIDTPLFFRTELVEKIAVHILVGDYAAENAVEEFINKTIKQFDDQSNSSV